jgi:pimeloyl-ACP methyl ester carboxylesterase
MTSLATLLTASGCAYLDYATEKRAQRAELKQARDNALDLARDVAPESCFQVFGRVAAVEERREPVLVVAIDRRGSEHEVVASREVPPENEFYALLLPAGQYDLLVFADLDHNGRFETAELVGRTPQPSPVEVGMGIAVDGFVATGPDLSITTDAPRSSEQPISIERRNVCNLVESLDDPLFDPKLGEEGMYRPTRLLARTQGFVFGFEPFDRKKTTVLFVHGITATPRDFKALVAGLDRTRFQPWFFYYPSGLPLDKTGGLLAKVISTFANDRAFGAGRVAIVAHSMGGLVARRALEDLTKEGRPPYLVGYLSLASPYGGLESAAAGVKHAPEVVPAWRDVAAGSEFLKRLHSTPLPRGLPFYVLFAWGTKDKDGPSPAGDGVVPVRSQLDMHVQENATRILGFEETHVGILNSADARRTVMSALDAMAAAGTN